MLAFLDQAAIEADLDRVVAAPIANLTKILDTNRQEGLGHGSAPTACAPGTDPKASSLPACRRPWLRTSQLNRPIVLALSHPTASMRTTVKTRRAGFVVLQEMVPRHQIPT